MFSGVTIWFITILYSACGDEVEKTNAEEFETFCENFNLGMLAETDLEMCTLTVFFEVTEPKYKDCFHVYDISLTRGNKAVNVSRMVYNDTRHRARHVFGNVTFGVYSINIIPICTIERCPRMNIEYGDPVNMSNNECIFPKTPKKDSTSVQGDGKEVLAITFASVLLMGISAVIYWCYLSGRITCGRIPLLVDDKIIQDTGGATCTTRFIEIYLLHYYDKKEEIKRKVEIVKDFLLKSSYFNSVKTIEDELAIILFNVNDWMNNLLGEREKEGTMKRIILITSQEETEQAEDDDNDDAIESIIFTEFIKKLDDNIEQCPTVYDNVFIVPLNGSITYLKRFKNVAGRNQYCLSGASMQNQLIDLCLNLCSGLKLNACHVKERIKKLILNHPIRHLGNCEDCVECA